MNSRILIVGGTGFIGYHVAKKALEKGWKVTSVSLHKPKKYRYLSKVNYLLLDIANKKKLKKKISSSFNYVVNLGGYVDHSNSKQKSKKILNSHLVGTMNLADIFIKKKIKAFIQIGSSLEYGSAISPQKENDKCYPKSTYAVSKYLSTIYLLRLFSLSKFPVTILRLYQAYGPKQDINRFLPNIILGCKKNIEFPCSAGNQMRDFLFIDDVVSAIFYTLNSKKARGEVINIGYGKPQKIKKIINQVRILIGKGKPQFGKIKLRKDEVLRLYPSINKAFKKLKWKPKMSLLKGLKNTIRSYK